MLKITLSVVASLLALGLAATPVQAQTRVFVAAQGSDSNPCTFALPCRTFQHAHDVAAAGGEIDVLDPAGYGALTITKSISIQGHDFSGVTAPGGGTGITINAGLNISLRGLIIEGAGAGATGISFNSSGSLIIENCVVRNLLANGIAITPTGTSSIAISDTLVAQNGGDGIRVQPTGVSNSVRAIFNRVQVYNNLARGIAVLGDLMSSGTLSAKAVDSVASYNTTTMGFFATGGGASLTTFSVFRSTSYGDGIRAEGTAQIYVSQTNLEIGGSWSQATGGAVISYGDNYSGGFAAPGGITGKN